MTKNIFIALIVILSSGCALKPACERSESLNLLYSKALDKYKKDKPSSLALFEKAAKSGHAGASHELGYIYVEGREGIPLDFDKAYFWFSDAAKRGLHDSMFSLGIMNKQGQGREKNLVEAYAWYSLAADYIPKSWSSWHIPRAKIAMYERVPKKLALKLDSNELESGNAKKEALSEQIFCSWNGV